MDATARLLELIADWRSKAQDRLAHRDVLPMHIHSRARLEATAHAYRACADELESALSPLRSTPQDCRRCHRPETSNIHDIMGQQGTGTAAVHPFIGDREAAIILYAAVQLGWSKKSLAHAQFPSPAGTQWNAAIASASAAVAALIEPIDPQELADYNQKD